MVTEAVYDLAIIGGGINGCGIARDAAGRGLRVLLCERNDLASGTSSASTKLIHGGLRYLEYREFRLVREALTEREVLWRLAPHLIRPLRFVLPYRRGLRPWWMLRLGLLFYDRIGGRERLPPSTALDLRRDVAGLPLKSGIPHGFEYSDCAVDDARLVVLNARDAAAKGADILTRTRLVTARRGDGFWRLTLEYNGTRVSQTATARVLVNAAGPWVGEVAAELAGAGTGVHMRLVRGSHIIVPRLYDHDRAYVLQQPDGRVVFVIPYEDDFCLIGTTDMDHVGNPDDASISEEETDYLCASVSAYFRSPLRREHVVSSFSGIRPLYDDGSDDPKAATRDYRLELAAVADKAPLITIYGGKITTYRRLAETVLEKLAPYFPGLRAPWTKIAPLPGGDFAIPDIETHIRALMDEYPFLDRPWARRLFRAYGTGTVELLGRARRRQDLGRAFGATLTEVEVRYLVAKEWATTAEDVLWRRSKLGLRLTPAEVSALEDYLAGVETSEGESASESAPLRLR
ncbi:MAG: glycerol-3-phosphate dehydrogenase [Stellaceae bacterium]